MTTRHSAGAVPARVLRGLRLRHLVPRPASALTAAAVSLVILVDGSIASATSYTITVDASMQTAGNPRFWTASIGTGTASLALRADLQTHASHLHP